MGVSAAVRNTTVADLARQLADSTRQTSDLRTQLLERQHLCDAAKTQLDSVAAQLHSNTAHVQKLTEQLHAAKSAAEKEAERARELAKRQAVLDELQLEEVRAVNLCLEDVRHQLSTQQQLNSRLTATVSQYEADLESYRSQLVSGDADAVTRLHEQLAAVTETRDELAEKIRQDDILAARKDAAIEEEVQALRTALQQTEHSLKQALSLSISPPVRPAAADRAVHRLSQDLIALATVVSQSEIISPETRLLTTRLLERELEDAASRNGGSVASQGTVSSRKGRRVWGTADS